MARSSVEILGGQLTGSIIQNAASEATLQELVRAVNKISKNVSGPSRRGGGGGGGAGGTPSAQSAAKFTPAGMVASLAGEVGEQIGNVLGSIGSIAGLLASNNQKLSSYTSVLNDQVIKKLPLVGGALGVAGDVVNTTIGTLESWNDSLKTASQSGASFGNSILRIRKAASMAFMELDDFVSVVSANSTKMIGFGGTVTQGAETFARYNNIVKRKGGFAYETLMQIGFDSRQVSEMMIGFMDRVTRGTKQGTINDKQLDQMFEAYTTQIVRISYLTGLNAEQQEQAMAEAEQDTLFQLKMNSLGETERLRMTQALREFSTMFPKNGAALFKAMFLGVQPVGEGALILGSQFPGATQQLQRLMAAARNRATGEIEFNKLMEDSNVAWHMGSKQFYLSNQRMIELLSTVEDKNSGLMSGLTDIITPISRVGIGADKTADFFSGRYQQAMIDMKNREGITKFLNTFGLVVTNIKNKFIDTILPYLEKLGKTLEEYKLGDKLQNMARYLGRWMTHYAPDITKMLTYLGSEEGRKYLGTEIRYFLKELMLHAQIAIKRVFYDYKNWKKEGIDDESVQQLFKALGLEKEAAIKETGVEPLFRTPMPADTAAPSTGDLSSQTIDEIKAALGKPLDVGSYKRGMHGFGRRKDPFTGLPAMHEGVDLMAGANTPIKATHAGIAQYMGAVRGYGQRMLVVNKDGTFATAYSHMDDSKDNLAFYNSINGKVVGKGDIIGRVGSTGKSTGPHLHYEVMTRSNTKDVWKKIDPEAFHGGKFRQGTLGVTGQLFKDFGGESYATLSGTKAVLTPQQMNDMVKAGGTISVAELAQTLNSNMSMLISLTKEKISVNRSQLSETARLSGDVFAAV